MKAKITYNLVSKLKPAAKEYEVRDTELKGLVLRVKPSGKMVYSLVYARGKRVTIGPSDVVDHDQARKIARGILADHYRGDDPIAKRKRVKADSYRHFLDETYKPWLEANIVHGKYAYDTLVKGFPELHELSLTEITPGHIEKWRLRRLNEGISPSTVNRQLSDIRACLNRARDIWGLLPASPLDKTKSCKTDNSPKVRYLTEQEESSLLEALDAREEQIRAGRDSGNEWRAERGYQLYSDLRDLVFVDHLKPAVLLSLYTGLRRGELLKLKWENVHFDQRNLTVIAETSKTGKTRHIPLNDEAVGVLKQWKEQPGVKSPYYVFAGLDGLPLKAMRTSWEGVLDEAEIVNFRWHDLRHTFASKLVMAGVDLNTVRELLGHSDYKMTLRYAHLAPEHKALAVAKLVYARAR